MLYPLSYEGMWDILLTYARISKSVGVYTAISSATCARAASLANVTAFYARVSDASATYDQPCALPSFYRTRPDAQDKNR